tara:strand:+ start:47 stop:406 length:360 start_codon:yes stop_codon:yes gene_type:complete
MNINPNEDEIRIQSAVAVEILSFLQKECRTRGGNLLLKDFDEFGSVNYNMNIPKHIPRDFADKIVRQTVDMVLLTLISVMKEHDLKSLSNNMFTTMMRKFDEKFIYNMIKDSNEKDKGR